MANSLAWISGGGSFLPSDLAGLTLWYRPESLSGYANGASIGTWADSSASAADLTQATAFNQPIKVNSDPTANNQPGATVSTVSTMSTPSIGSNTIVNGNLQTLFIVMNTSAVGLNEVWSLPGSSGENAIFIAAFGNVRYDSTDNGDGKITWSNNGQGLHIWEFYRNVANVEMVQDGSVVSSFGAATGNWPNESVTGVMFNTGCTNTFYEFANYNVALSSGNRSSVRAYLKTKFGTP